MNNTVLSIIGMTYILCLIFAKTFFKSADKKIDKWHWWWQVSCTVLEWMSFRTCLQSRFCLQLTLAYSVFSQAVPANNLYSFVVGSGIVLLVDIIQTTLSGVFYAKQNAFWKNWRIDLVITMVAYSICAWEDAKTSLLAWANHFTLKRDTWVLHITC